ncbi:AraC family transcriptional regulator [Pseudomonas sp. Gutcm_11s]|uniref:AraC family transcriptional regulator n=1 Tax=Pseudomonas sp. Gutcm_11s TaxID=3026088 RepID=UPI00235FE710|nr:AraC family transcriptional regulator [Pseudomonas sp. Gutcm_11s]MDD0841313.1 AraC family transcriptional regulator [Pseudomonas sp. Gutcm_11s]
MSNAASPLENQEGQRRELAQLIAHFCPEEGIAETSVPGLALFRSSAPLPITHGLCRPALCIMAQGQKVVRLEGEVYAYDPLHYLVAMVTLPITGEVTLASPDEPYLSLRLDIDPNEIGNLLAAAGPVGVPSGGSGRGLHVDRLDAPLLDAVLRLVRLLESPRDIAMLAPLVRREILYRLLHSPQGQLLRDIATADSQAHRINLAIEWLNSHYHEPLRIDELARLSNLSTSTLHHRFKAVTAMSPLQYQKQLRLQEARRLMLCENLDVSSAGYKVGYESPSQFSREYSRLFGEPPVRDLARLRSAV